MSRKTVTFVSDHVWKMSAMRSNLGPDFPHEIAMRKIDLPVHQGSPEEICLQKCRDAATCLVGGGPVVVEDSSLCFNALGGLPGAYADHFAAVLGAEGLVNLLAAFEDKSAYAVSTIAVSMGAGEEPILFQGRTNGTIVDAARGVNRYGWDACFQPDGSCLTYAEMEADDRNEHSHYVKALRKLKSNFPALDEDRIYAKFVQLADVMEIKWTSVNPEFNGRSEDLFAVQDLGLSKNCCKKGMTWATFLCKLCTCEITSIQNLQSHVTGARHLKLEDGKLRKNESVAAFLSNETSLDVQIEEKFVRMPGIVEVRFFAEDPNFWKNPVDLFVAQAKGFPENFGKKNKETGEWAAFYCSVCDGVMNSIVSLRNHIAGRRHIRQESEAAGWVGMGRKRGLEGGAADEESTSKCARL